MQTHIDPSRRPSSAPEPAPNSLPANVEENIRLSQLWERVPCNLCGSWEYRTKYEGTTDVETAKMLRSYSASSNFISSERLVECDRCGLVFTSPRLRQDLILKSYQDTEDPVYVSQSAGRIRSFEKCIQKIARYQSVGRILDIGAAAGFFLKVAKDRGWETFGIEPSKYLSEFGNRHYKANIFNGTVEDVARFPYPMDVVTLWDVLEHTFDPMDVLARCNRYLRPGGLIAINYPNIDNWMAKLAGRRYWFILSVHIYYFTPTTIAEMLRRNGFAVVESTPHFQRLQLGYLLYRLEAYLPRLAKPLQAVARTLGIDKWLIPYFAAQTCVIGKKVAEV